MSEKETPLTEAFFLYITGTQKAEPWLRCYPGSGGIDKRKGSSWRRNTVWSTADHAEERLDQDLQRGYGIKEKERVYNHGYGTICV